MNMVKILMCLVAIFLLEGCKNGIFVTNACVWGVDADVDKVTQTPHGKVGVVSLQNVYAPTNKGDTAEETKRYGACDVAPILVETEVPTLFDTLTGGTPLKTRVVIGEAAKNVTGVLFMMRDKNGEIDEKTVRALEAIAKIKSYSNDRELLDYKAKLVNMGVESPEKKKQILIELSNSGYDMTWDNFCDGKPKEVDKETLKKIYSLIEGN